MTEGIDYAWFAIDPAHLHANGWSFICRYLANPNNTKNLTPAEAARMSAGGVDIVVVFETTGKDFTGGRPQGQTDARTALAEAEACGIPAGRPIYFAVDEATQDWGHLDAYLQGCADILGAARVGIYGSYDVCAAARASGFCDWLWQTYAWSSGRVLAGIHLYQYLNGQSFDHDRAMAADFGQWRTGQPAPGPGPAPSPQTANQEAHMFQLPPGSKPLAVPVPAPTSRVILSTDAAGQAGGNCGARVAIGGDNPPIGWHGIGAGGSFDAGIENGTAWVLTPGELVPGAQLVSVVNTDPTSTLTVTLIP